MCQAWPTVVFKILIALGNEDREYQADLKQCYVCMQISSPSGKALFQWMANETGTVDFYICALSFGQNDLGERQRIGATVSIYLNGTFVW